METTPNQELQELLERIRREGVEKAKAEAEAIIASTRAKADEIVRTAETRAAEMKSRAETDTALTSERGRKALEQAARDTMLSVQSALANTLRELVVRDITANVSPDAVRQLIAKVVDSYLAAGANSADISVFVAPALQKEIAAHFMDRLAGEARRGLKVHADHGVVSGFKVGVSGKDVQHDFTGEAIADSICQIVRPQLAAIVKQALQKT